MCSAGSKYSTNGAPTDQANLKQQFSHAPVDHRYAQLRTCQGTSNDGTGMGKNGMGMGMVTRTGNGDGGLRARSQFK